MIVFASDNCSSAHPEIFKALNETSTERVRSYGFDELTKVSENLISGLFVENPDSGLEAKVFFVFNGTAANCLALASYLRPGEAVLSAKTAHINEDEGGAPEAAFGLKLLTCEGELGKISPANLQSIIADKGNVHRAQPGMISISQTTEVGTQYSVAEIKALADFAHSKGLSLHLDGSRLSNAVAWELQRQYPDWKSLDSAVLLGKAQKILRSFTSEAGVDCLSLGGTKNGLLFGEAVVFFTSPRQVSELSEIDRLRFRKNAEAVERFPYLRKNQFQLGSKMRYLALQMKTLYEADLWLRNALAANEAAAVMAAGIVKLAQDFGKQRVDLVYPTQGNAVFATIPIKIAVELQKNYYFYLMDEKRGLARLMGSWDSKVEDVETFLNDLKTLLAKDQV